MPAGEDIYQTIGFILEVKDLASAIATKAQKILDATAAGVENTLLSMTTNVEAVQAASAEAAETVVEDVKKASGAAIDITRAGRAEVTKALSDAMAAMAGSMDEGEKTIRKALDPIKVSLSDVGTAFKNVFGEAVTGPMRMFEQRVFLPLVKTIGEKAQAVQAAFATIPEKWGEVKAFFRKDITFEQVFDGAVSGAKKLGSTLSSVFSNPMATLKKFQGALPTVAKGFGLLKTGAVSAYTGVNQLFQTTLGLAKSVASVGKMGLVGALLGPLGPILSLLSPIINALSKAFAPALETLGDLLDAVFAPFAGILDTIMQSLMPLIQKALGPLVSLLELGAVQVGVFLQGLTDTTDTGGMLGGVLETLMPAFSKVMDALVEVGKTLLPVIVHVVQMLVPIIARVIAMVANAFAKVLPILAKVVERVLPKLVDAIGKILDAVLPLIPPLLDLGVALIEKVFAPLLIITIEKIAEGISLIAEYITPLIPDIIDGITSVTDSVIDFYSNFSKYMGDLYILFLEPIVSFFTDDIPAAFTGAIDGVGSFLSDTWDAISGWWDSLVSFFEKGWESVKSIFDFSGLASSVGSVFDGMLAALEAPIGALKKAVNDYIISPLNSLLGYDLPVIGKLGDVVGIKSIPSLAAGGIATDATLAQVGEGRSNEAIVPLTPESITKFVAPVISAMPGADLRTPEADGAVGVLKSIERLLRGTLTVKVAGGESGDSGAARSGGGGSSDDRDLDAAVGADGMAWATG